MKNPLAKIVKNRGHFAVSVPIQMIKEGKAFVAFCPALDIATQGNTFEEAQKMFQELVMIFIEEIDKMGTINEVLSSLGWTKSKNSTWVPPDRQLIKEMQIDIPCPA